MRCSLFGLMYVPWLLLTEAGQWAARFIVDDDCSTFLSTNPNRSA